MLTSLEQQGFTFQLAKNYQPTPNKTAIIVHDIDISSHGTAIFTKIEAKHGIRSTFYLRAEAEYLPQNIQLFQSLEQQGWEIGFHYDSLSRTNNQSFALTLFKAQLTYLRTFFNITTTRAHGDEYNYKIDNYTLYNATLWQNLNLKDYSSPIGFSEITDSHHDLDIPSTLGDKVLILLHTDWW